MLRKLLIAAIKGLLWLLDADHRRNHQISDDDMHKFTHIIETDFQSDFGRVSNVMRTVPYEVWQLTTTSKRLLAADRHRVIRSDNTPVWLSDLHPGDYIHTDTGPEQVISCRNLGVRCHMYSLEVDTPDPSDPMNHLYYTDGILSHNTTVAAAFLLWKAMFTDDFTVLITANNYNQALEIMERVRYAYEGLPDHIRAGVREYNKSSIHFDNRSRIISRATTAHAGRGLSISLLYVDEFAAIPPNIAKSFWTAIRPTLANGGACIITSTPLSDEDQFAQIWKGAIDNTDEHGNLLPGGVGRNGFFATKFTWRDHPDRDEKWAETERASLGPVKFLVEHECEFVGDSDTLINPLVFSRLHAKPPAFYIGAARWYHEPDPNRAFIVALDPSLGMNGDYGAIEVFQLPEMIQVAEWQSNNLAPRLQAAALREVLISLDYTLREHPQQINDPELFWTFENNTIGEAILQIVEDSGEDRFPGMLVTERKRKNMPQPRVRRGMNTTPKRKLSACARLKSLIETDRMDIRSQNLISELKNFVAVGSSYKAKSGEHDDLVSATMLAIRAIDVMFSWGVQAGSLREYIQDDEISYASNDESPYIEAMPVVI